MIKYIAVVAIGAAIAFIIDRYASREWFWTYIARTRKAKKS